MNELTPGHRKVLDMVKDFIDEYGMHPNRMEIANALCFKSQHAEEENVKALQKQGVSALIKR